MSLEEPKYITVGEPSTRGHLLPLPDNRDVVCNPLDVYLPPGEWKQDFKFTALLSPLRMGASNRMQVESKSRELC